MMMKKKKKLDLRSFWFTFRMENGIQSVPPI
jgi:hypothetical protein